MSEESLEISNQTQIKCSNLEKFKQIDSEQFEKILNLTNKKPIFTPKINRRKLSYSKIEFSSNQNYVEGSLTQNIGSPNRNSLVKNICSFLENRIQNNINSEIKNNSYKKNELISLDSKGESSSTDIWINDINAKISLNSIDYSIKCEEFDAFELSNNNNNNNDKKNKDEKTKSRSKDKQRDKDKEEAKKSKLNENEKRKGSKSEEKDKKKRPKSITKIVSEEKGENKNFSEQKLERLSNNIEKPVLKIELEVDKNSNHEENHALNESFLTKTQPDTGDHEYSDTEIEKEQEFMDYPNKMNKNKSNIEVIDANDLSELMNQGQLSNVTSSYSEFRSSVDFSTSTKKQEDELNQNLPLQTATKVLQYITSFISVTTPENKNLWLSLVEKTGDSIIDILTMKDEENRNIWLTWLKDQCSSLDQLSKDLINDIEAKIMRIEYKNF